MNPSPVPTLADLVTATGYGLGLWWAFGGPTWAGLSSIVLDELDGPIARAMGQTSERGSALDWGADVSLTGVSALRLGQATVFDKVYFYQCSGHRNGGWCFSQAEHDRLMRRA